MGICLISLLLLAFYAFGDSLWSNSISRRLAELKADTESETIIIRSRLDDLEEDLDHAKHIHDNLADVVFGKIVHDIEKED